MYDENSDPHIQIAVDYNLMYKSRTADIRNYLDHVSNLGDKFKRGQMYLDEMSQVLSYLSTASVVSLLPGLLYYTMSVFGVVFSVNCYYPHSHL